MSAPISRLLAFDCAGNACSAALWRDGEVVASRRAAMTRGQAEQLVPMIEAVMAEGGLGYDELEAVAVTRGPGGFTGLRIGLATARGLALARDLPILGLTSFEVLAAAVPESERAGRTLAVLIDAKRADLFAQAFGPRDESLAGPLAAAPEALDRLLPAGALCLAGDAVALGAPALAAAGRDLARAEAADLADAAVLARLAAARVLPPAGSPAPEPLYLRAPDVTVPAARAGVAP